MRAFLVGGVLAVGAGRVAGFSGPRPRAAAPFYDAGYFDVAPQSYMWKEGPRLRSDQWARNLASLPRSRVLVRIRSHLAFTLAWTTVCLFVNAQEPGMLPKVEYPALGVLGTTISLLLAFRTSQSYERYWEGRGIWKDTWTTCRTLKRSLTTSLAATADLGEEARSVALALVATFPLALMHHLRNEFGDVAVRDAVAYHFEAARAVAAQRGAEGNGSLDDDSSSSSSAAAGAALGAVVAELWILETAARGENVPVAVTEALSRLAHDARREGGPEYGVAMFEAQLSQLVACVSAAERLVMTPVPPSYTRHTSRLLSLWSLAFPLCFKDMGHPLVVLGTMSLVSWSLYALEEIDKIIEEPFGTDPDELDIDLPLARYAALIANDVLAAPNPNRNKAITALKSANTVVTTTRENDDNDDAGDEPRNNTRTRTKR